MTYFEKLPLCSGGNLYDLVLILPQSIHLNLQVLANIYLLIYLLFQWDITNTTLNFCNCPLFHVYLCFSYFFLLGIVHKFFFHILFCVQDFPISFFDTIFLTLDLYNISVYLIALFFGPWWYFFSVMVLFSFSHFSMHF